MNYEGEHAEYMDATDAGNSIDVETRHRHLIEIDTSIPYGPMNMDRRGVQALVNQLIDWLMKEDEELIAELKRDEGVKLKPYLCPAGKWTIGTGRNIEDNGITVGENDMMLYNDIQTARRELTQRIPDFKIHPWPVRRALINMHFNLGWPKLSKFKRMLQAIEERNYVKAAYEAEDSRWFHQVGGRAERVIQLFLEGHDEVFPSEG